jgi:hypothetical protein
LKIEHRVFDVGRVAQYYEDTREMVTEKECGKIMETEVIDKMIKKHEKLWNDPSNAEYLVTFAWSAENDIDFSRIVSDSAKSLEHSLAKWQRGSGFEDDSIPVLRVEIGTGLVASAFGAELLIKPDNLPAVKTQPIQNIDDLGKVKMPDPLNSGYFPQIYKHIEYFRKKMPSDFRLCQCDMQGPWNSAQLLVGNKIFLDIYDDPKFICSVLDAMTDFMIKAIPPMKQAIGEEWDSFYLQGTKIPGASRLCNCSTDMISPDFYEENVLERDNRFLEAMNGGMMHICGNNSHCIQHFNKIEKLKGLEVNFNYLDAFKIADMLREDIVLLCTGPVEYPLLTPLGLATLNKFYKGEFPDKKNIFFHFNDPVDLDKCKKLYDAVHE